MRSRVAHRPCVRWRVMTCARHSSRRGAQRTSCPRGRGPPRSETAGWPSATQLLTASARPRAGSLRNGRRTRSARGPRAHPARTARGRAHASNSRSHHFGAAQLAQAQDGLGLRRREQSQLQLYQLQYATVWECHSLPPRSPSESRCLRPRGRRRCVRARAGGEGVARGASRWITAPKVAPPCTELSAW